MFAMFGIGLQELLVLGMLMIGVPVVIITTVFWVSRKDVQSAAKPCPKCGMLAREHGFCPHCGAPVDAA